MPSNSLATRRHHHHHHRPRKISSSEEIETTELDVIPSRNTNNSVRIVMPSLERVRIDKFKNKLYYNIYNDKESVDESPLIKIIERKQRKDW
jgi:hypothetical protein